MKFLLERGPTLEILENVAASGQYVATLEERPDVHLPPELTYILQQFAALSQHRPAGMGISAIPFTEIEAHWRIYLKEDEVMSLQEFADWITLLDEVVMDYHRKKDADTDKTKSREIKHG
jgi:hypothetical protein